MPPRKLGTGNRGGKIRVGEGQADTMFYVLSKLSHISIILLRFSTLSREAFHFHVRGVSARLREVLYSHA